MKKLAADYRILGRAAIGIVVFFAISHVIESAEPRKDVHEISNCSNIRPPFELKDDVMDIIRRNALPIPGGMVSSADLAWHRLNDDSTLELRWALAANWFSTTETGMLFLFDAKKRLVASVKELGRTMSVRSLKPIGNGRALLLLSSKDGHGTGTSVGDFVLLEVGQNSSREIWRALRFRRDVYSVYDWQVGDVRLVESETGEMPVVMYHRALYRLKVLPSSSGGEYFGEPKRIESEFTLYSWNEKQQRYIIAKSALGFRRMSDQNRRCGHISRHVQLRCHTNRYIEFHSNPKLTD